MPNKDWIVESINNPEFTAMDFYDFTDMTPENVQILSKEDYKQTNFIKNNDAFKDKNGKFDEKKFDKFYEEKLNSFGQFHYIAGHDTIALDIFDTNREYDSNVKTPYIDIFRHLNPNMQKMGVEDLTVISDPQLSQREIAKKNKIYLTEEGRFIDESVNDQTLITSVQKWFQNLVEDPLVLATWDSDGTHEEPLSGRIVEHKKGEAKLNSDGYYYYETLGDRSAIGKDVLSVNDTLTVDGEGINKYDFFDSNDIKKSTIGSIVKNTVAIAPLFLGPNISNIYSATYICRELAKSLPMLHGILTAAFGDYETPEWMKQAELHGRRWSSSISDYGSSGLFNTESFTNLISDVVLQWGQQKAVVSAFNGFKDPKKILETANERAMALYTAKSAKLGQSDALLQACIQKYVVPAQKQIARMTNIGQNISLGYMVAISNADVYNDSIAAGATKREAAAIALGSSMGMFVVDKYLHLGEAFFHSSDKDKLLKATRQTIRDELGKAQTSFTSIISSTTDEALKSAKLMHRSSNIVKRSVSNFYNKVKNHSTNLFEKMVTEGLEEVGEEIASDLSKGAYELLGAFGIETGTKDVGAFENVGERYLQSFLGGAVGGGIFGLREAIAGNTYNNNDIDADMITMIREGHADELRKQANRLYKEGKLGDTKLSATQYEKLSNGNLVWKTAKNEDDTQNAFVHKLITDKINAIEKYLNKNEANLSDEQLFNNLVLSNQRYNNLKGLSGITDYYQDYNRGLSNLIKAESDYEKAANTIDGTINGKPITTDADLRGLTEEQKEIRKKNLEAVKKSASEARQKVDQFLSKESSSEYLKKLIFASVPRLHEHFLQIDKEGYFKQKYKKSMQDATNEELLMFEISEWQPYVQTQLKAQLDIAFDKFKQGYAQTEEAILELQDLRDYNIAENTEDKLSDEEFSELVNNYLSAIDNGEDASELADRIVYESVKSLPRLDDYGDVATSAQRTILSQFPDLIRLRTLVNRYINNSHISESVKNQLYEIDLNNISNPEQLISDIKKIVLTDKLSSLNAELDKTVKELTNYTTASGENLFGKLIQDSEEQGGLSLNDIFEYLDEVEGLSEQDITNIRELIQKLNDLGRTDLTNDVISSESSIYNYSSTEAELTPEEETEIENLISKINSDKLIKFLNGETIVPYDSSQTVNTDTELTPLLLSTALSKAKLIDENLDVEEILNKLNLKFQHLEDASELILNDAELEQLKQIVNTLDMLDIYVTAATTTDDHSGYNEQVNDVVYNNAAEKGLVILQADEAAAIRKQMNMYRIEIANWIRLSESNSINKIRKFVATDTAVTNSFISLLKDTPKRISINGKEYDLLAGTEALDFETGNPGVNLFKLETAIYDNIREISKNEKISIQTLVEKHGLLELFIPDLKGLNIYQSSQIDSTTTVSLLSTFDKLQYITTIISENPRKFYSELNQRVENDPLTAPIVTQELGARIAGASANKLYRSIFKYALSTVDTYQTPLVVNTTVVPGVAGAGKTQAILKAIDSRYKNDKAYIVGPTIIQAKSMQEAMGRDSSMTIDDLFTKILGEKQYAELQAELQEHGKPNSNDVIEHKHYTITGNSLGNTIVNLTGEQFKFNEMFDIPKVIYIDEATHLSTVQILILNQFAEKYGIQVYLVGDPSQNGYYNPAEGVQNMDKDVLLAPRTPRLTLSLRDNNIQKFQNLGIVRTLLDDVLESSYVYTTEEYKALFEKIKNIYSKFNLRVYTKDEINGELITKELTPEIIEKIKTAKNNGKTIGFIGDVSSLYLQKLREAGIEIENKDVMSVTSMQGSERDLIIVDYNFEEPKTTNQAKTFLKNLYTLMSRSREGTIFIDNGLSNIIGDNIISGNKAKAPSIQSGIKELREKKLEMLKQLDLNYTESKDEQYDNDDDIDQTDEASKEFKDPNSEAAATDEAAKALKDSSKKDEEEASKATAETMDTTTELVPIQTYEHATPLTVTMKSGKTGVWKVEHPVDNGPLRNLQALFDDGEEISKYDDKIAAQQLLSYIKSMIVYGHSYESVEHETLYSKIKDRFSKENWNDGKLSIEFREVTDSDSTPLYSPFKELGINTGGKQILATIVFTVKDNNGRDCKFDIAGLNDPTTLSNSIENALNVLQKDNKNVTKQSIEETANKYQEFFDKRIEELKSGKVVSIQINEDAIILTGTTMLKKRKSPIRLGTRINPDDIDVTDAKNLRAANPNLVISDVYCVANNGDAIDGIDQSVRGKAVVFVSADTTLSKNELAGIYVKQKTNPNDYKHRVRMIVLDNIGISFSNMTNDEYISKLTGKERGNNPVRQNFAGMRMFTSLWNARASLINFKKALEQWKGEKGYDDEKLEAILKVEYLQYSNSNPDEIEQLKNKHKLTDEDIQNVKDFNDITCKDIPMFRLSYVDNENGFYIRRAAIKDSIAYKNKKAVNLVYINLAKATQFENLLNPVIRSIVGSEDNSQPDTSSMVADMMSLSTSFLKADGTSWDKSEYIDFNDSTHQRSLSGLLSSKSADGFKINIEYEGTNLAYPTGSAWSSIPLLLHKILKSSYWLQNNQNSKDTILATVRYKDGKGEKKQIKVQVNNLIGDGLLEPSNGEADNSLSNLFDLVFHGTIEDYTKPGKDKKPVMQADDAYFKHGFFISPDAVYDKNLTVYELSSSAVKQVIFYKVATSEALFTSNVDGQFVGVQLDFNKILNPKNNQSAPKNTDSANTDNSAPTSVQTNTSTPQKFEERIANFPIAYKEAINAILIERGQSYDIITDDNFDKLMATINETINQNNKNYFDNFSSNPDFFYRFYLVQTPNGYISVEDHIKNLLAKEPNRDIDNIKFSVRTLNNSSKPITILLEDGSTYEYTKDNIIKKVENQNNNSTTEGPNGEIDFYAPVDKNSSVVDAGVPLDKTVNGELAAKVLINVINNLKSKIITAEEATELIGAINKYINFRIKNINDPNISELLNNKFTEISISESIMTIISKLDNIKDNTDINKFFEIWNGYAC